MLRYLILTIVINTFIACGNSKRLSNQNLSLLYNTDQTIINPEYSVFHYKADSSRLYFNLRSEHLLFKKNDAGLFEAEVNINFQLFDSYKSTAILDSGTIHLMYLQDTAKSYIGFLNFKMLSGTAGILKISCSDRYRNQTGIYFERINKVNSSSSQFYFLSDEDNQPLFSSILSAGEKFKLHNNITPVSDLKVRYYNRIFPLAAPPFNSGDLPVFDLNADSSFLIKYSDTTLLFFTKPGIYHLQTNSSLKEGATIFVFKDGFPTPSSASQLIECLRYITTRKEHTQLNTSADIKKAVDDYWLKIAGNRDQARKLIREYYTRVQDANRLFSSYVEGWKTDRGMIYIIYGSPQTIYRDDKNEQWAYTNTGNLPDLDFIFEHVNNPFTNEDYNLIRSPVYETPWYMAVDEWRNGRIVNGY